MTQPNGSDDLYAAGFEAGSQQDPSETLTGDNTEDPLDFGYSPPDREPRATRFGTTAEEQRSGETIDQLYAEQEPDISVDDVPFADEDERAGRLVAPDEGAHADRESDAIATDVGRDGLGSSAEEAAMHVVDEDA